MVLDDKLERTTITAVLTIRIKFKDGFTYPPIKVHVLGLIESGEWCALAMEMSLRGFGETFDEAFSELKSSIRAQILFAFEDERGDPDCLYFPAESKYFKTYLLSDYEKHKGRGSLTPEMLSIADAASKKFSKRPAATSLRPQRYLKQSVSLNTASPQLAVSH